MAIAITGTASHTKVVIGADDPSKEINKSQWNGTSAHDVAIAISGLATGGQLLYSTGATTLAQSSGLTWNAGGAAGEGLAIAAGTATTAVSALAITQAWNNAAITFPGFTLTITDTASAAGSLAYKFLGGAAGTTLLSSLDKSGNLIANANINAFISFLSGSGSAKSIFARVSGSNSFFTGSVANDAWVGANAGAATGRVGIGDDFTGTAGIIVAGTYYEMTEATAPAAPGSDKVRIYAVDNGGKTELLALFSSGAAQRLAIQP